MVRRELSVVAGVVALLWATGPVLPSLAQPPEQEYVIETVVQSLVTAPIALRAAGTVLTAEAVIPGNAPDESYLRLIVDQDTVDRVNPAIHFSYALERRLAPDWLHICGGTWIGVDAFDDEYGLPYVPRCLVKMTSGVGNGSGGRALRNKRGWRIRGHFELPQALALGWRIDVVTQD